MAVQCSSCSVELPDDAKFCGQCGSPQAARCPACGAPVGQPDQRFCFECGTSLRSAPGAEGTAPRAGAGRDGPGASSGSAVFGLPAVERRLVSVLFADLTGFTTFSEGRDAEDVRVMLSDYFATARRIVTSYGGTVEKFIGDAVMAVWGAPVAREDDAERSVRAALDLVAAITGLSDRLGLELALRVGVLTGEAAVELTRVGEGMVVGDSVNTASRLQTLATPGSVLVDDVTRLASERAIAYEDAGAHLLKGKSTPVQAWRPLRVVAALGGAGRVLVELPLVGRRAELGALREALDRLLEPGADLRLLSVIGEAGIGKSRLAWELEKYADGLAATVLWHRGQASSFGQGVGFWALGDMVRMRAEVTIDDPHDVQRAKLAALVEDVFGDELIGGRVGRALRRLLGVDDGSELIDRGELFSSWRLLFERLAARDPVLLLFEDLHWADQGLFDFIAHLAEWAERSPILVLVFSRPDQRLDVMSERGVRIDLAPLTPPEIETLVGQAVSDAPAELVGSVRDHADGVPLFAVESLRMLVDRGVMVAEGDADRYRVVGDLRDLEVPPNIHALIAARLDALGADERHVVLDAAVLGQRFSAAASAILAGVAESQVRGLLDGLVAKQFLTVTTDPRSPERGQYAFAHRQSQRVALSTMSKHARKARHLGAAEWLAQGEADDLAGIFAGHLLAAADADPQAADAPAIRRRALAAVLEAARRAASVGGLREAVALFEQAAEIEPDEQRRAEHFVEAARCAERYGDQEAAAAEHYAAARRVHELAGRSREALSLRARELYVYRWTRPAAQLIEPLRAVYDELDHVHDGAFAAAAAALAGVLYSDGDATAAELTAGKAAEAARSVGAQEELGLALNCRASALIELGRPGQALDLFRAALSVRELYAPADVPSTLANIAITLSALGRFEEAADAAITAIAASDRVASQANRELATLHLARMLFCIGKWDEALDTLADVANETTPANAGMTIGAPVLIALARGTIDVARSVIEAFDRGQADSGAAFESDYRSLRAAALAHLDGDPARALAAVLEAGPGDYAEWPTWLPLAVDLLVESPDEAALHAALAALASPIAPKSSPHVRAQTERLAAHVASRNGDLDAAAAHWRTAVQIMSEAGVAFDVAVLGLELAERVSDGDRGAGGGREAALATFKRLGAEPWLRRARQDAPSRQ
jgi:class 3 adenylate cyclase/tetratricopeptide (TPR) repeat protein